MSLVSTTYRAARAVKRYLNYFFSPLILSLTFDKPASLTQIFKLASPDCNCNLLAPQTVSVISLAAMRVSAWGHRSTMWALWGQLLWIQFVGLQAYVVLLFCLISTKCELLFHLDLFHWNHWFVCAACDCDPEGSESAQCKEDSRCQCLPGFVGARCDMCEENYFYTPLHTRLPAVSQLLQPGQRQGQRLSYEHSTFCFITEQITSNTSDFFFFFLYRWTSRDGSFMTYRIWLIIWTILRIQWVTRPLRTDWRRQRKQ